MHNSSLIDNQVICFASYGERSTSLAYGTPISFNIVRGIELLCCSLAEANELLEDFNQRNSKRVVLSEDLKHHLYVLTGGHLGFLSRILSFCLSRIDITDDQSLAMFILSNAFVADICELRGVPRFGQMSDHQNAICREIILSGLYTPPRGIDEEREMMDVEDLPSGSLQTDGLTQLIREGWVCKTGDRVTFSSPVIVYVASIQLFGAYRMNDEISNFVEFLFLCLQRLDPANLRDSLGRGNDDTLLERSWQMEFYRAATTCLGRKSHISPDVGHVFGSSGYIDFYVNGDKQWAIELTREGSEVREHESRFTGIYALIPMKEKAVIDFRVRPVRKYVDLVWYVQYDATNYRTATVSRKGLDGMIHQADITFNGNQAFIPFLPKEW